jgi:hypothetical protein
MKLKNIILGLGLSVLGLLAQAQNGLENILVERYYVANAADAAGSVGVLPVGSVTYRVYADMLPGYKFQAAFGDATRNLKITTTTSFFNNQDRGATTPSYTVAQAKLNTVMLDSWLSAGAAAVGQFGVLKSEDNGVANVVNSNGLLANNVASMGIPLTTQDGLLAGAPLGVNSVGDADVTSLAVELFNATSNVGGSFIVTNGAWGANSGAVGPTATNRVLIGQFTTDGVFHIELNIQIGTSTGGTEKYVHSNPVAGELTASFLNQTFLPIPLMPTVSVSSPATGTTFPLLSTVPFTAVAADADGSVSQVEFFVDGVSVGVDVSAPFTASYTGVGTSEAPHSVTAKATDNEGFSTTSAPVTFNFGNAAPAVTATVSAPANGLNYVVGDVVTLSATATDPDGTVASIQFKVDGVNLGAAATGSTQTLSASLPYTALLGNHSITAVATDNNGKPGTSATVAVNVSNNVAPAVAITAPANNSFPDIDADLVISANATDADGTVSKVEFFKNGTVSLGTVTVPVGNVFSLTVPKANLVLGGMAITAVATDNKGGVTTSTAVDVIVKNFKVAYEISYVKQECYRGTVCMPVRAVASVSGVIGYNFTLAYDKTKVNPTGAVTVNPTLLSSVPTSDVIADTYIDAAAGTIAVSIYFKGSAPTTAAFNGTGDICCVQFDQLPAFTGDATTTFSFASPGVTESYPTQVLDQTGQDGTFEIFKDWFLFSNLKNWSDGQAIKYDPSLGHTGDYLVSDILGSSPQAGVAGAAVQPDLTGKFKYDIRNGLKIDIQRDILNSTLVNTVIEGYDAFLASRVSLGVPAATYTPAIYNIIAMDVNRDTRITAGDATQINRRSVNAIQEFTQVGGEHKDWLFVAKTVADTDPSYKISANYPQNDGVGYSRARVPYISKLQDVKYNADYTICPDLRASEDYLGVMVGDVDQTYATPAILHDGLLKSAEAETTSEIVIDLSKATIVNGNIQLPVSLKCAEAVNSYSFQLTLKDNVQVNNIVSTVNANLDWNFVSQYNALLVSTYISGTTTIPTTNTIANISVNGIASISINDLTGVTSKINGKDAKVVVIDATMGINDRTKDVDVQVYPNPASDRLNIVVSKDSKVQILDLNGKRVGAERNVSANQKQVIDVTDLAKGIYMVRVSNSQSVEVKKVVIK